MKIELICFIVLSSLLILDVGLTFRKIRKYKIPIKLYVKSREFIQPMVIWLVTFGLFITSVLIR